MDAERLLTSIRKVRFIESLGVPKETRIPNTLLNKVQNAKVGSTVKNPTKTGNRQIHVTGLLKKKVVFTNNARESKR